VVCHNDLLAVKRHGSSISAVDFSADGLRIVTAGGSMVFSPDGVDQIGPGDGDGTARIWDISNEKEPLTLRGHGDGVFCAAFSPDGRRLVTTSADRNARIRDASTGQELAVLSGHTHLIRSAAFSPDGRRLVTASADGTCRLWDATTGKPIFTFAEHKRWVMSVAFSPDGQRIASAGQDDLARVWDATTGKEQLTIEAGGWVWSVVFSPDGQRILTGNEDPDKTAKIWDATTGRELLALKGHRAFVMSAAFSPDGRRIATASSDRTAKVWEAASPEQVAGWRQEEQAFAQERAREALAAAEWRRAPSPSMPGGIKQWLVLLPIPYEGGSGRHALETEQVFQESRLRPRPGDRVEIGRTNLVWREIQSEDYHFDFNEIAGRPSEYCVAYAVCYLESPTSRTNLLLRVGSDDQAKIILNGREVYRFTSAFGWKPDRETVPGIELNAGWYVLIFKVVNPSGGWGGSIRITEAAGQAVEGLRSTLTPP
jgi:dipeptidyl aminopeptidase/acylaminoacyl peptidase